MKLKLVNISSIINKDTNVKQDKIIKPATQQVFLYPKNFKTNSHPQNSVASPSNSVQLPSLV
jgi:hypothetical protein